MWLELVIVGFFTLIGTLSGFWFGYQKATGQQLFDTFQGEILKPGEEETTLREEVEDEEEQIA